MINDGSNPNSGLIQASNGIFYGVTYAGGSANYGIAYKMTSTGTVTVLHNFYDGSVTGDGANPAAPLIQGKDSNFYGTTPQGGSNSVGVAFKMTSGGTVTILHNFADGSTLNDLQSPATSLVQGADNNFYGTAATAGGTASSGGVYVMTPQGFVTVLHSFADGTVANDGTAPTAPLILGKDGIFYGTTSSGGDNGNGGTIYAIESAPYFLSSPTAAGGSVTVPFSYPVATSIPTTSYAAANLPTGLGINTSPGLISGTPTTVQTKVVTLTLTNPAGAATFPLTLTIGAAPRPVITSVLASHGTLNLPFTYLTVASNSATSYSATGLTGTGLSFDTSTGIISGTPTKSGVFPVTLAATNGNGVGASASLSIEITDTPVTLSQETILHRLEDGSFPSEASSYSRDPFSLLLASDGNFYYLVSTFNGNYGIVYRMTPQGSVSVFYTFIPASLVYAPTSLMQASDGNFYGTARNQVFKLTMSGQLTLLHAFAGVSVMNGLIQGSDGNFYGRREMEARAAREWFSR